MATSPNIANYYIGAGVAKFTPTAGVQRDLGNCLSFKYNVSQDKKQHKSFRSGAAKVDKTSYNNQAASVTLTLDEITPENLAMQLFGTVATNSAGNKEFGIFDVTTVTGVLELTGTNDQGSKFKHTLNVSIAPSGGFDAIGEDYATLELTADLEDNGSGFGTIEEIEAAA